MPYPAEEMLSNVLAILYKYYGGTASDRSLIIPYAVAKELDIDTTGMFPDSCLLVERNKEKAVIIHNYKKTLRLI